MVAIGEVIQWRKKCVIASFVLSRAPLASLPILLTKSPRSVAGSRVLSLEPPLPRSLKLGLAGVAPSRATRLADSTVARVATRGVAPASRKRDEGADVSTRLVASDLREPANDGSDVKGVSSETTQ